MTDTFAQLERVKDTAEELHRYVTLTAKERDAWRDQAQKLKAALEKANEACLCTRNTIGFDYSETHRRMGKARVGARWLTPRDMIGIALREFEAWEKENE